MATKEIQFDAAALQTEIADGAPLALLEGTNVNTYIRAFDDSTEEFVLVKFRVPEGFSSSDVTFSIANISETPVASRFVKYKIGYASIADGEDYDVVYTDIDSGDQEASSTADYLVIHSWISSVTWTPGDLVLFRLSRIAPSGTNLVDDLFVFNVNIKMTV